MGFSEPDTSAQDAIDEQRKREEEERQRQQVRRQQGTRSTQLTGPGGVGDTSTAVRRKQLTGE